MCVIDYILSIIKIVSYEFCDGKPYRSHIIKLSHVCTFFRCVDTLVIV